MTMIRRGPAAIAALSVGGPGGVSYREWLVGICLASIVQRGDYPSEDDAAWRAIRCADAAITALAQESQGGPIPEDGGILDLDALAAADDLLDW